MKTLIATAAILGLTASGALAECGHDSVKAETTQSVATLDLSTTASTDAEPVQETVKPAEAE
jgi:hypothetical protein